MRSNRVLCPWLFRIAVAVTAAAMADPIVERLSEAGIFGAGHFTDRSNVDVLPAMAVAFCIALALVAIFTRRLLRRNSYPPQWLRACALDVNPGSLRRMLPTIFVLQLIALFGMETLEQIATAGHPLGGTLWLGGPVLCGLAAHVLSCIVSAWALYHGLRWSARAIVRAVRVALEILRRLLDGPTHPRCTLLSTPRSKCIEPYLRALQGRAPPQSCRV
jgi:hypothetical protein